MAKNIITIYQNNQVKITSEQHDKHECRIDVNGQNLIWISKEDEENFKIVLNAILDKYRI